MVRKLRRKENTRKPYKFIYIFTEGTKTEPNYFKSKKAEVESEIRRRNIKIEIKGKGFNTVSLVDFALSFIEENQIDLTIDECWVVFDKDSFDRTFNNAITKAEKNSLRVAYSNESFELWLLLHLVFFDTALTRDGYSKKLTEHISADTGNKKYQYSKTEDIYSLISDKEASAIRNARKLLKLHENEASYVKKNPSTTVHLLVESLNKLKRN